MNWWLWLLNKKVKMQRHLY
jgi:hypothetical protein